MCTALISIPGEKMGDQFKKLPDHEQDRFLTLNDKKNAMQAAAQQLKQSQKDSEDNLNELEQQLRQMDYVKQISPNTGA